jgi:hypothetical protein
MNPAGHRFGGSRRTLCLASSESNVRAGRTFEGGLHLQPAHRRDGGGKPRCGRLKAQPSHTSRYRESHATGPKGIAKIKLAIEVARDLLPEFCSQGLLVELAPLSDAALVSAAVASVMGQILVARRFHWPWSLAQSPSTRPRSVGEVGKDAEVNAIFDEALGILGHAELLEPDPLHSRPRTASSCSD